MQLFYKGFIPPRPGGVPSEELRASIESKRVGPHRSPAVGVGPIGPFAGGR